MKIVILDGAALNPGDLGWQQFEKLGEVVCYDRTPEEKTIERIGETQLILTNKTPITEEVLSACPQIRYIGALSTGTNVIDTAAAKQRRIVVSNVPDYSTEAVAQHTFALLLESTNHVGLHTQSVAAGDWVRSRDFCYWKAPLKELAGQTIGLIGYGKIGRRVAQIARAFSMQVQALARPGKSYEEQTDVRFVSMETLLATSDVVSLHCPLTTENSGMIGDGELKKMKRGAVLLNTARGPLVDEKAIAKALKDGTLGWYGADVVQKEPMAQDSPLLSAPHCLITPHIAWAAQESRARLMEIAAENLRAYLAGKPQNVV